MGATTEPGRPGTGAVAGPWEWDPDTPQPLATAPKFTGSAPGRAPRSY